MTDNTWPLITLRYDDSENTHPKFIAHTMDITRHYPGTIDEIWLADGSFDTVTALQKKLDEMKILRKLIEPTGIQVSFQQGITLNHGIDPSFAKPSKTTFPFLESDWQIGKDGKRLTGILCPRSENGRNHLYDYVSAILSNLKPNSYWLDDDLRMGVCKPDGCFCDRCIAAFNKFNNSNYTREELVSILYSDNQIEPLRERWCAFNEESLCGFAAFARKAADDTHPTCRLGYQAVWANEYYTGRTNLPLLKALSGPNHHEVGIRPGASGYREDHWWTLLFTKSLSIMREAERCHATDFIKAVTYEEENYPRRVIHKSPEAIMLECSVALACGCDSLSIYWHSSSNPEPAEYYENFLKACRKYRRYFELLAASSRKTSLGGIGRYLGSNCFADKSFCLNDTAENELAKVGIPITVAEAHPQAWLVTKSTIAQMTEDDFPKLFSQGAVLDEKALEALLANPPAKLREFLPAADNLQNLFQNSIANGILTMADASGATTAIHDYAENTDYIGKDLHTGACVMDTTLNGKLAVVQEFSGLMTSFRRTILLDVLDIISNHTMPARLDCCHLSRIFPRLLPDKTVNQVSVFNYSMGETPEMKLTIRRPDSHYPIWHRPGQEPLKLDSIYNQKTDELTMILPVLPGYQTGTVKL